MPYPLIMVAPNGARRSKSDHSAIPLTTDEIVDTARACAVVGADALHLHVRDTDGQHSLDVGLYQETLAELHANVPDLPIQITTEAAGVFDVATQLECLQRLVPKWASISVREIARDLELTARVYATCNAQGTKVQHILYDTADIALLKNWQASGTVKPDQSDVLLVLGRYTKHQQSRPTDLAPLLTSINTDAGWMVCAFGLGEHACLQAAAKRGGDVRVGFENSLVDEDGVAHLDNAASVKALKARLQQNGITENPR